MRSTALTSAGNAAAGERSIAAATRACAVLPGGVSRDQLRAEPPLVLARGSGAYVVDVDGRRYLDLINNYTSLIHGHAHGPTVTAIAAQAGQGTAFGMPNVREVELAEELLRRLPGADQVRFTNSGTEAGALALQLARAATGRTRVAKFEGGYHGFDDALRVSVKPADGGERTAPRPDRELGVGDVDVTDVLPFDDVGAVERLAGEHGDTWAALLVEPMQGSAGMLPASEGLLPVLERAAARHGFLLVLDEVMTFRHGGAGLQSAWGLRPHLTTLGKLIGGGLPVGAVAGPRDVMRLLAPPALPRIQHAGTFNGNPLTMAAGLATLEDYGTDVAERLDRDGERLRATLARELTPLGWSVTGWGSMMNVHAASEPPRCWRDVRASDRAAVVELHRRLRDRGVLIAPRGMLCLSTAVGDAERDGLAATIAETAAELT